jgi:hypothetical protein
MAPYDPIEWGIRTKKNAIKKLIAKGMSRSDAKKKVTCKYIERQWKTQWVIKFLKKEGIPTLPKTWKDIVERKDADSLKYFATEAWNQKMHRDCKLCGVY